jgi:hypothetical protein
MNDMPSGAGPASPPVAEAFIAGLEDLRAKGTT